MTASRLLTEVIGEWQSCEDLSRALDAPAKSSKKQQADREQRLALLARTIEGEVIPRLMLSHRLTAPSISAGLASRPVVAEADVAEFARLVVEHDDQVAISFIDTLRDAGISVDGIFTDLVAPTARLLGEYWRSDTRDFADVTIGLARLQYLVHHLSPAFEGEKLLNFSGNRALLVPAVGEQHTLGIMIVEEYFRRAGWECSTVIPRSPATVTRLVHREHFDVVGFSVSTDGALASLAEMIAETRKASRNRGIMVLVGGQIFLEKPELVADVGADGTAGDGGQALLWLESRLDTRKSNKNLTI